MAKKVATLQRYTPDRVAKLRLEAAAERTITALWYGMKLREDSFDEFIVVILEMIVSIAGYNKLESTFSYLDASQIRDYLSKVETELPYRVGYESRKNGMNIKQNPFKKCRKISVLWTRGWFDAEKEQKKDALRGSAPSSDR